MRISALILVAVIGTLLLFSAHAEEKNDAAADRIQDLQRERISALKTMAEMQIRLFEIGKSSAGDVAEARVLVCEAELQVAANRSERIAALKKLVAVLKECENLAQARMAAAQDPESVVLQAKARRLDAEIRLERALAHPAEEAKNGQQERAKVVVTTLQTKDVVVTEQYVARICAQQHIEVRSQQRGYLEEIQVKEGQAVKKGDVLFKVAPMLYQTKLDAELAEVQLAELSCSNTRKLYEQKVVSAEELALAKTKLSIAQSKAKLAQVELSLTVIRAPFDGVVGRLQQQLGSLVTDEDALTTLSDNSGLWVYFQVPEVRYLEYMDRQPEDRAVDVELALGNGRKFSQPGKIGAIEAAFDNHTGSIGFRADFPNPEGLLRHGMSGTVSLRRTLKNALVVPQRATFEVRGETCVFVVDKEGLAQQRAIVIQQEHEDDFVVSKGLDANDRIVTTGVRQVHDGEKLPAKH